MESDADKGESGGLEPGCKSPEPGLEGSVEAEAEIIGVGFDRLGGGLHFDVPAPALFAVAEVEGDEEDGEGEEGEPDRDF